MQMQRPSLLRYLEKWSYLSFTFKYSVMSPQHFLARHGALAKYVWYDSASIFCCRYLARRVRLSTNDAVSLALRSGNAAWLKQLFYTPTLRKTPGPLQPQRRCNLEEIMWDIYDLEQAVQKGSVDSVAFALDHGCPWDPQVRGSSLGHCID
jgi:hypothetical protein